MYERFLDPYKLIEGKLIGIANEAVLLLPNLVAGLILIACAWLLSRRVRSYATNLAARRGREDLGDLLGSMIGLSTIIAGLCIAATVIFPSITPASLFASLGIGSVAVGFAFRDILQNFFAGVLIIITRPFRRGDDIVAAGFEGTVQDIQTRATLIRQADNRLLLIPNSILYVSPVIVDAKDRYCRDQMPYELGWTDEPEAETQAVIETVAKVDGVLENPRPMLLVDLPEGKGPKGNLRWFTRASGAERAYIRSRVALALDARLREQGVEHSNAESQS